MHKGARRCAIQDAVLFGVLALPMLGEALLQQLFALGALLGDPRSYPAFESPVETLLLHLFGLMGLFFAWVRIRAPNQYLGETATVKLLACVLFAAALWQGAPWVLLALLLVDLLVALLHVRWWRETQEA